MKNWMYRHLRAPPSVPDSRKPTWWKEQEYSSFQNITFIRSRLRPMYRSVSIAVLPSRQPSSRLAFLALYDKVFGLPVERNVWEICRFYYVRSNKASNNYPSIPSSLEIPRVFLLRPLSIKRQDIKGGNVGDQYLDNLY